MLAAAHRLHRSADFARALRQGRRCARSALVVHLSVPMRVASAVDGPALDGPALDEPAADEPAAEQAAPTRAGFVVSRTVGGAVVRNAVTRRLRALVRERLDRVPPGSLLVVRALPAAAVTPFAELGAQLDACLDRLTGGLGSEVSP